MNLCCCEDELNVCWWFLECFEKGVDRGRLDRNSLTQKLNSWCNISITTGEEPCIHDNSGGGTVNRVIECECVTKVVENGHEVSNFVKNNYGLFGRLWIEEIKKHILLL